MQFQSTRILEIGEFSIFKRAFPGATVLMHAGGSRASSARLADLRAYRPAELIHAGERMGRGEFDLIAMHANGGGAWSIPPRAALAWWLLRRIKALGEKAPAILALDFHDTDEIHPTNLPLILACSLYFKRELPKDHGRLFRRWKGRWFSLPGASGEGVFHKMRPVSIGISTDIVKAIPAVASRKTTDVFFAGAIRRSGARLSGLRELRQLAAEGVRLDLPDERLPRGEFYERCCKAWLTWSPPGLGWQCFRHDEAALCRSIPVMAESPLIEDSPFVGGEHCFYYGAEAGALGKAITDALKDKGRLERMAEAAREHSLRNHTHEAICRHVLAEWAGGNPRPSGLGHGI